MTSEFKTFSKKARDLLGANEIAGPDVGETFIFLLFPKSSLPKQGARLSKSQTSYLRKMNTNVHCENVISSVPPNRKETLS